MKIQLIRNATMKINYGAETFLTDPMLADAKTYTGFLDREHLVNPTSDLPITQENILEGITSVLVTHTHIPSENQGGPSDHFDQVAVELLQKDLRVYAQPFDLKGLKRVGFKNIITIDDVTTLDSITISRVEGRHADIDQLLPLVGDSSAYVLQAPNEPTVFWTGDTLLTKEMKAYISNLQPDVCIVHAGGAALPIDANGNMSQLVMNADDTIELAKLVPHAKVVAIHMEALDHCPVTRQELLEKATANNLQDRILIPNNGDVINLS